MINKTLISVFCTYVLILSVLSGCSIHAVGPIPAGKNSYVISKQSAMFAAKEEALLGSIFSQANEHCLEQKRYLKVDQLNEYVGLIGNDSKTTLVFSCLLEKKKAKAPASKVSSNKGVSTKASEVQTPVVKTPEKKKTFPTNNKLMKYSF